MMNNLLIWTSRSNARRKHLATPNYGYQKYLREKKKKKKREDKMKSKQAKKDNSSESVIPQQKTESSETVGTDAEK